MMQENERKQLQSHGHGKIRWVNTSWKKKWKISATLPWCWDQDQK